MSKTWVWLGVGIVSLALAGAAAFLLFTEKGEAVVELATAGGEFVLREPFRPIRGGDRVLLIALDGVGDDMLRDMVRSGRMPNLAGLFGAAVSEDVFAHAYAVPGALSILPSTTMAAWASVFTGEPAGQTGVPGNEWFVRETMQYAAPGAVTIEDTEHTLQMYTDDFLGRAIRVPTLYELADVRAHVSLAPISRGADLLTTPTLGDVMAAFAALTAGLVDGEPADREMYSRLDIQSVDVLLGSAATYGVPDLQVVYFPGIDLYTHVAERPLDEMERYLAEVTDPAIGRILAAWDSAGVLDDTWVILVADHGHTPVLGDGRHALAADSIEDPPAVLRHAGFRLRPLVLDVEGEGEDFQATVAYQGAMAYVYLADRSTCENPGDRCSWMLPPRLEEDVLPVVRAFDRANRTGEVVPKLKGTLDMILAREPRPTGEPALPFEVWDGEQLVPIARFLAMNDRPDLADFEARMRDLAEGPYGHRAGDVLLITRSGMQRPIVDRYYFSHAYHSWHGSPEWQDSRIPLMVARRGISGARVRSRIDALISGTPSQLDVVPIVLELLRGSRSEA